MKSVFLFLALLTSTAAFSQWKWQNPWPQGNNLNAVFATDPQHCWMVGDFGTILFDDGNTLSFQNSGTYQRLRTVHFFDNNEGWAGGENGILLHFKAGAWTEESSGLTSGVNTFHFLNKDLGWAVCEDGRVLKFEMGIWSVFATPTNNYLNSLWFDASGDGWVGGNGFIQYFDGINWVAQPLPPKVYGIYWIKRLGNGTLWASCSYEIDPGDPGDPIYAPKMLKYENNLWTLVDNNPMASSCISFVNDSLFAIAGGDATNIYNAQLPAYGISPLGVAMTDKTHAWVVGENGGISFFNGATWKGKSKGFYKSNLQGVAMFDQENGIAVGGSSQYYYRLEDTIWVPDLDYNCGLFTFRDLDFKTNDNGWGVGTYGDIWHYAGAGFECIPVSCTQNTLYSVAVIDESHAWVGGSEGTLIKVGLSFGPLKLAELENFNIGPSKEIYEIYFSSPDEGWAVGWDSNEKAGFVYQYTGNTWSEKETFHDIKIFAFFKSPDSEDIWVAGQNNYSEMGAICHFDGQTWATWEDDAQGTFRDIHFTSPENGWAVGDHGKIAHFKEQSWNLVHPLTTNSLRKMSFIDNQNGWIAGTNATILHIVNGDATTSTTVPDQGASKEKFWVSPNPATDFIALHASKSPQDNLDLTLFDGQGNVAQQYQNISLESLLDVSQLKSGLYFWRVSTQGRNMAAGKFLVLGKK